MNSRPSRAHHKPLDFGAHGITGSVDQDGKLIALNFYHPRHGYVTLTTADPFPESERYNPSTVRAYRAALATLTGYGLVFDNAITERENFLLEDAIPRTRLTFANGSTAQITTLVAEGGVIQWQEVVGLTPRWQGCLSLQRCAYTQLTEGGPIAEPPVEMRVDFQDGILTLENPFLGCAVAVAGLEAGNTVEKTKSGAVTIDLTFQPGLAVLAYGIGLTLSEAVQNAQRLLQTNIERYLADQLMIWRERWRSVTTEPLVRRGLVYGLAACIPVNAGICILTDHMLLPLSWNRDAYYVARALLSWNPDMAEVVRRHLIWMFEIAQQQDHLWGRCYLANGEIKDKAFQLDQQVFPLLELSDYVLATHDLSLIERLRPQVEAVLAALFQRKAPHAMLFPTDETPADDPITLPYHLSSHILLWRVLTRPHAIGLKENYLHLADELRQAIDQYFIARHQSGKMLYAYATDGQGHFHFYHDANDLPLVLAPVWQFVALDNPTWRATVEFAFSEANCGGIYGGRLGSVHTQAPWSLGDIQDLIIARVIRDTQRETCAWQHLHNAAQTDGALPEAYQLETGAVISRHWFAWPNAVLAGISLEAFHS